MFLSKISEVTSLFECLLLPQKVCDFFYAFLLQTYQPVFKERIYSNQSHKPSWLHSRLLDLPYWILQDKRAGYSSCLVLGNSGFCFCILRFPFLCYFPTRRNSGPRRLEVALSDRWHCDWFCRLCCFVSTSDMAYTIDVYVGNAMHHTVNFDL